jgi:hypothetical protein
MVEHDYSSLPNQSASLDAFTYGREALNAIAALGESSQDIFLFSSFSFKEAIFIHFSLHASRCSVSNHNKKERLLMSK